MVLDPETVRVVSTLGLGIPTAMFVAATTQRHNEPASRTWSIGFLLTTAAVAVTVFGDDRDLGPGIDVVLAGTVTLGLTTTWMGARLLNGRSAGWLVGGAAAVLVGLVASFDPELARVAQLLAAIGVSALAVHELGRGSTSSYVESRLIRVLLVALGVLSLAALLRQVFDDVPEAEASDWRVLAVTALFQVTSMVALSALREGAAERVVGARIGRTTVAGLLTAPDFLVRAEDQVERAATTGEHTTLVVARVEDLDSLATAYGLQARELAVIHVSTVLRENLSASTLLGYLGAGRFAALLVHPGSSTESVDQLRRGLATSPTPDGLPLRMATTVEVVASDLDAAALHRAVPAPRKLADS